MRVRSPWFLIVGALLGCGSTPEEALPDPTRAQVPAAPAVANVRVAIGAATEDAEGGLLLTNVGDLFRPGDEAFGKLDQLALTVDREGARDLGPLSYAEPWRGLELPRTGLVELSTADLRDVPVRLTATAGGVVVRVESRRCTSWDEAGDEAARLLGESGGTCLVDAKGGVQAGHVISLLAVLLERGLPVALVASDDVDASLDLDLLDALGVLTSGVRRDEHGQRLVGVRMRVDARAPWGAVQSGVATLARALITRISFAGVADGGQADLYPRGGGQAVTTDEAPVVVSEEQVESAGTPADVVQEPDPLPAEPEEPMDLDLEDLGDLELDVTVPDLGVEEPPLAPPPPPAERDAQPANPYDGRRTRTALAPEGGSAETEASVQAALRWLVHHQRADGSWDADGWSEQCGRGKSLPPCAGPGANRGEPQADLGVTALSVLALLGQGRVADGPYQPSLQAGLRYLLAQQREDGGFGEAVSQEFTTYPQPLATIALCEAYALGDATLEEPARRALGFCLLAQNPGLGWKYGVKSGRNDTAVTGWMVAALRAGERAGFEVPEQAKRGALSWFRRATADSGQVGYETPGGGSAFLASNEGKFDLVPAMTAVALFAQLELGLARDEPALVQAVELLSDALPAWADEPRTVNFYYWFHGTNALFQRGEEPWSAWNEAVQGALLPRQRKGGCEDGSWDPVGEWCLSGGRVYATALNALTLQTYYRLPRR